jgi:hypothetical protein
VRDSRTSRPLIATGISSGNRSSIVLARQISAGNLRRS